MNLYELSARYQQLIDKDELDQYESDELESLHGNIEDECIERGKYIRNLEAEYNAINSAISEMEARLAFVEVKANKQKEKLAQRMSECNISKITKSPLFPLRLKQNPPSIVINDVTMIDNEYRYQYQAPSVERINKDAIKVAIESGKEVKGALLIRKLKVEFK